MFMRITMDIDGWIGELMVEEGERRLDRVETVMFIERELMGRRGLFVVTILHGDSWLAVSVLYYRNYSKLYSLSI